MTAVTRDSGLMVGAMLLAAMLTSCAERDDAANALTPGPAEPQVTEAPPPVAKEQPPPSHSIRFTDVTADSGIDFTLTSGRFPTTQILEAKGAGLALIDINNNGLLDLFIPNGTTLDDTEGGPESGGWRLYENLGDLLFRDISESAGVTQTRWAFGAAVGDIDGDGYDDIFITCFGPDVLLRNNRNGTFTDVTESAFAAVQSADYPRWSTGAAFGDLNNNGMLDLYVARYLDFDPRNPPPPADVFGTAVFAGPRGMNPQPDVLYLNNGDGTFTDITHESAIGFAPPSYGLGVVILDFNDDGRQDIFVGNDSMRNFLYLNQGLFNRVPRFSDFGDIGGIGANALGSYQSTRGIAIADVSGNNLPDVFTSNFAGEMNALHVNLGNGIFEDQTQRYGLGLVSKPFFGWACGFFDLDHNGREELFIVNSHIYPQATRELMDSDYEQPPLLFKRQAAEPGRFQRMTDDDAERGERGGWLFTPGRGRAVAFADLDNDGDIDLIAPELGGRVRVLRNESRFVNADPDSRPQRGDWLIVQLHDAREGVGNHRGLGSRVELFIESADSPAAHRESEISNFKSRHLTRWIYGGGFMSSSAHYAHFGIPAAANDHTLRLRITWPDGHVQDLAEVESNRRLRIARE